MAEAKRSSYQDPEGLERAIVDLVRVGMGGHTAGVRQLAARLIRALPPGLSDPAAFRSAVHEAMASSGPATGLRFSPGTLPTDRDSSYPLADVEQHPDGHGLIVSEHVGTQLDEVVTEHRHRDQLARAGLAVTRTVLLTGPPGVGKTMAAGWFAERLELPLIRVGLSAIVSSYLGNSGRNIRSVLNYAAGQPCVLLFDEFDAVAKMRDDTSEIGELKRVVNVVLTELDRWPDTSLLVAATNHPHLLDPAVGRRFDRRITFSLPDRERRLKLLETLDRAVLASVQEASGEAASRRAVLEVIADLTAGASGSDLTQLWNHACRAAVLRGEDLRDTLINQLVRMLSQPGEASADAQPPPMDLTSGPARDRLWWLLATRLSWSHRRIASQFQVSHPTVGSGIRRASKATP